MSDLPLLYGELSSWWPLLSAPQEYEEEAAIYLGHLRRACSDEPSTLLELGSGGGSNASHMKAHLTPTLVDLSPGMLSVSRALNPELEHHEGDMRTVRLDRQFDCVFVHDAVCHMITQADLQAAMATAYVHTRPGGAALFAPDDVRETYESGTDDGGHDGDGRALRYFSWSYDPDPSDDTAVTDYVYLLREGGAPARVVHDQHLEGLFSREQWLQWLREVGFEVEVEPFEHSEVEPGRHLLFVCRRP